MAELPKELPLPFPDNFPLIHESLGVHIPMAKLREAHIVYSQALKEIEALSRELIVAQDCHASALKERDEAREKVKELEEALSVMIKAGNMAADDAVAYRAKYQAIAGGK